MLRKISSLALLTISLSVLSASAEDWLQFRGPNGQGISKDTSVPTEWSATKNVKWKYPMPGRGFSSPIVVGDLVFLTSYTGSGSSLTRQLVCINRKTGKAEWTKEVKSENREFRSMGGFAYHGYASSSPISDGERVYVMYGTTGLIAYDLKGKQLWKKNVGTQTLARFGSSSSPVLYKDMVIMTACSESATIYAFNKKTGEKVWAEKAGSLSSSYSTPLIVTDKKGEDQLLINVSYEIWSMNPKNGKFNWWAQTQVDTAACTNLILGDGVVYAVGGRSGGRSAVKLGGKPDKDKKVPTLWSTRGGSYVPSPVLHKGHLYWANQSGNVYCVDAKTGKEVNRKRLGGRANVYASTLLIGDKLYIVTRYSGTYVLEANTEMKQIAKNSLGDSSDTSGTPAVSNGDLFLRSDKALYCIGKK